MPFDPSDKTVDEVKDYLAKHPNETDAVLDLENEGKGRKGILNYETGDDSGLPIHQQPGQIGVPVK